MIRVGGGWDTLEHYLDRHDPCRCGFQGNKICRYVENDVRDGFTQTTCVYNSVEKKMPPNVHE